MVTPESGRQPHRRTSWPWGTRGRPELLVGRRQRLGGLDWLIALGLCVIILVLGGVPSLAYLDYGLSLAIIYTFAALGSNVIFAYLGEANLGAMAALGVGAYSYAALAAHRVPALAAAIASIALGALFGGLMGLPNLRIRGIELALVTFGFAWAIPDLISAGGNLTGGAQGISVSPDFSAFGFTIAGGSWLFLLLSCTGLLLVGGLVAMMLRSGVGRIFLLLSGAEAASKAFGMRVGWWRLSAWVLAGAMGGTAGVMYAETSGFLTPREFPYELSLLVMAAGVVGGATALSGALVAGVLVGSLPDILSSLSGGSEYVLLGLVVMVAIALGSGGFFGIIEVRPGSRPGMDGLRLINFDWQNSSHSFRGQRLPSGEDSSQFPAAGEARNRQQAKRTGPQTARPPFLLSLEHVSLRFGGLQALSDVCLSVGEGEWLGIVGPNGSGKSSLLNCISGAYIASDGHIIFGTRDVTAVASSERARLGMLRTFQSPCLSDRLSVAENVWLGAWATEHVAGASIRPGGRTEALREALSRWGLASYADSGLSVVPYGVRKLVELARLSACGGRLFLIDEPAAGLSPEERSELLAQLRRLREELPQLTLIVVEHDIRFVRELCDSVVALDHGRVVARGTHDEVFSSEKVMTSFLGLESLDDSI